MNAAIITQESNEKYAKIIAIGKPMNMLFNVAVISTIPPVKIFRGSKFLCYILYLVWSASNSFENVFLILSIAILYLSLFSFRFNILLSVRKPNEIRTTSATAMKYLCIEILQIVLCN